MSRVTAPASKIARSISSTAHISTPLPAVSARTSGLLDHGPVHNGSILMPKYAELLKNRSSEPVDSSRGLTTTHRPTPQPSLANRSKPLMQPFSSSSPSLASSSPATASHLDASVLPMQGSLQASSSSFSASDLPRMPLLPDNHLASHAPFSSPHTESVPVPGLSGILGGEHLQGVKIVAADPDKVSVRGRGLVEAVGLDGVDIKFVHETTSTASSSHEQDGSGGMLRDIWKGMVDDVLGAKKTA